VLILPRKLPPAAATPLTNIFPPKLRRFPPPLDRRPRRLLAEQAALIDWKTPFTQVCDYSNPPFARWFVGGTTNLCHNAVDRHLATGPTRTR
jgi:hypothetical protein